MTRVMFTDPFSNVAHLQLLPGQSVVDLGAGSGFYTIAAAKAVGAKGKVYAVDVQKELLSRVKADAAKEHIYNVEVIWGDFEHVGGTHIPDNSVDAAIISNVFFQIADREHFLEEVRRILRVGGRVLVIDWSDSYSGMGPASQYLVKEETLKALFAGHGFTFERSIPAGDSHYGFVCRKQ